MVSTTVNLVDSSDTILKVAEEATPCVLPAAASQRWLRQRPNTYGNNGPTVNSVAGEPIDADRKPQKGAPVSGDLPLSFTTDLTLQNNQELLQGWMAADQITRNELVGDTAITAVAASAYTVVGSALVENDLFFGRGFAEGVNNGLKVADTGASPTSLPVVGGGLATETPSGTEVKIVHVGFQFTAGDAVMTAPVGAFPVLTTTTKDLTSLPLNPGDWVVVGDDATAFRFDELTARGLMRVRSIDTNAITFDKTQNTVVGDVGAGKTIRLFWGRVLKDQVGALQVRRTYQGELQMGTTDVGGSPEKQAMYIAGAVPSVWSLNLALEDKVTADLSWIGVGFERRILNDPDTLDDAGAQFTSLKSEAPSVPAEIGFSESIFTTANMPVFNLRPVSQVDSSPTPYFALVREVSFEFDNQAAKVPAQGFIFGADVSVDTFRISGNAVGYYGTVKVHDAIINAEDATFDYHLVNTGRNEGISLDLPLVTLGEGQPTIEKGSKVQLPVTITAAQATLVDPNYTHVAMFTFWDYIPALARP